MVALALLMAAPTQAKDVVGVRLCGSSGCVSQHVGPGAWGGLDDGAYLVTPAKPGSWFRGYLVSDDGKVYAQNPFYYVPGGRRIARRRDVGATATWTQATGNLANALDALADRVRPYRAPSFAAVAVNGVRVADPQSYVRLWTMGSTPIEYPVDESGKQIVFRTKGRTPWSDGNDLVVYPKSRLMVRDGQVVSISGDVASRVAARASLGGRTRSHGDQSREPLPPSPRWASSPSRYTGERRRRRRRRRSLELDVRPLKSLVRGVDSGDMTIRNADGSVWSWKVASLKAVFLLIGATTVFRIYGMGLVAAAATALGSIGVGLLVWAWLFRKASRNGGVVRVPTDGVRGRLVMWVIRRQQR